MPEVNKRPEVERGKRVRAEIPGLDAAAFRDPEDDARVVAVTEPDWPEGAVLSSKDVPLREGRDYTRAEGKITFSFPRSVYAPLELRDSGGVLLWKWSAVAGVF